jgi:hypothetical protein
MLFLKWNKETGVTGYAGFMGYGILRGGNAYQN